MTRIRIADILFLVHINGNINQVHRRPPGAVLLPIHLPITTMPAMKQSFFPVIIVLSLLVNFCRPVTAATAEAHREIQGPFSSLAEVNMACMKCHRQQVEDIKKSVHWTWQRKRTINGKTVLSTMDSDLSRFAIVAKNNQKVCYRCHIGTFPGRPFLFNSNNQPVNCLSCHDTTGLYSPAVDPSTLEQIARRAGRSSVRNCLNCHDQQCGLVPSTGESVTSDVHMQRYGFTCLQCHPDNGHHDPARTTATASDRDGATGCTGCHDQSPHTLARLNRHALLIDCRSCHIPIYGDVQPVIISWNWLLTDSQYRLYRQDNSALADNGFLMGTDIRPVYGWDDGSDRLYQRGDRARPGKSTMLQGPGPRSPASRIMPFSLQYGVQLQDKRFHYLLSPLLVRQETPFLKNSELERAVSGGMQAFRLPYSGEATTAVTVALRRLNHGVKPASQSLACLDCHGSAAGFGWHALGYQQDPWTNGRNNIQPPPPAPAPPTISLPPVEESVLPVAPEAEPGPSR